MMYLLEAFGGSGDIVSSNAAAVPEIFDENKKAVFLLFLFGSGRFAF